MNAVLFWVFAATSVISALFVVGKRSPLGGALALSISMLGLAGLFATLSAQFLFIIQILVYAGAVVVLIVFVIMLLNLKSEELKAQAVQKGKFFVSAVMGLIAAGLLLRALGRVSFGRPVTVPEDFGFVEPVAMMLLGQYVLAFEVISLVLLVGIIGAVVLAKRGE